MASQQERRAETRQRLLTSAAELFAGRGIEAASVDAIAEAANRTSGAIYDHFGGKDGLLFALFEEWTEDVAGVVFAERYRLAWEGAEAAVGEEGSGVGVILIALLLGLEMLRRVDPAAVTDETAIAALRGAVTAHPRGTNREGREARS